MPTKPVLDVCSQKNKFNKMAEGLSVDYPKSIIVQKMQDLDALYRIKPPYVLKPDKTSNQGAISKIAAIRTQKALIARSNDQVVEFAELLLKRDVDFIVQELVAGGEQNIFSYHAFNDEQFRPLGSFVGRKIRTYPSFGGRSTCVTLINDEEVSETGRRIAAEIGIAGPIKLDFKRDAQSGKLYIIEANPRFTLWNHLGAECGVNLALVAYQYLSEVPVSEYHSYRTDRHWITFADDLRSHMERHSGRLWSVASYPFQRKNAVSHVFALNDPLPFLVAMKRLVF